MRKLGLTTTTTTGCALEVKHPFQADWLGNDGELRPLPKDCWTVTLSCQGEHQNHEVGQQ